MSPVPFALSALTGCASGSAGDVTATGNQHGRYFIDRPVMVDAQSFEQRSVRTAMTKVAQSWGALSTTIRVGWETYAQALRLRRHSLCTTDANVTGRNLYFRHNIPRFMYTNSQVAGPPTRLGSTAFGPVKLSYARGVFPQPNLTLTFHPDDEWHNQLNGRLLVAITIPVPETTKFYERAFLFKRSVLFSGANPASFSYNLVIGNNQRLFCKCRAISNDGRTSKLMHVQSEP